MLERIGELYTSFFGSEVMVAPEYLLLSVLIAWVIFRIRRRRLGADTRFRAWLLPREVYRHKSARLDLTLFAISRLMVYFGLMSRVVLTTATALAVARFVGGAPEPDAALVGPLVLAFLLWLVSDFTIYWVHRAMHRFAMIWPLHAVHHSAEVLTPFTAYRQHPLSIILSTLAVSVAVGVLQGLLIGTLAAQDHVLEIASTNAFAVMANAALANFHHSHIWLSYGRWLEHVFISPAQHQIHHSSDPRHFNRNFGMTLALWDWLFGTLYVIRGHEALRLGLDGPADESLRSHRLWPALIDPLKRMKWKNPLQG